MNVTGVERKESTKHCCSNGKRRKLGIPTAVDRVIQQAIAQVLTPIYEPKFVGNRNRCITGRTAKSVMCEHHAE